MDVQALKQAATKELDSILRYWTKYALDKEQGGVVGQVDNDNTRHPQADKGAVLHARVLWTFSAAYQATRQSAYRKIADEVYRYFVQYFIDPVHGGVYWTIRHNGEPLDTKKQVYAQAFAIFALSAYYAASGYPPAREEAIKLYHLLQQHSYDPVKGGYFEAFGRAWNTVDDGRLSSKDANEKKTMNTHLHVLEAYSTLYGSWPQESLRVQIQQLLQVFDQHIINPHNGHLHLFFDEHWQVKGDAISYGHDIEASWLLLEAAERIQDEHWVDRCRQIALTMSNATLEGMDVDGGLWYEYEPAHDRMVQEKHWWPQAEAVVGFVNAWQISGEAKYAQHAIGAWQFIDQHLIDHERGEWYWGMTAGYRPMPQGKVGLWKCPYHNGRACLEIMKRL
ncbi:AGE family epimerase/isomerase [Paraflavitalea pollutisoli]|uniref:AGE family epimerase/isomerase n=1 Tax=Paraflavitalea pollutisoli TaxID=3034143 RepID=UPI0023ED65BF|nr:AGE family epimerase/isomerase [Paraflavitalea sp. H1-2-19X]